MLKMVPSIMLMLMAINPVYRTVQSSVPRGLLLLIKITQRRICPSMGLERIDRTFLKVLRYQHRLQMEVSRYKRLLTTLFFQQARENVGSFWERMRLGKPQSIQPLTRMGTGQ